MAKPNAATMFVYNVGFGDCILLRFTYPDGTERHVLIDFGTTKKALKFRPPSMEAVAEQIKDHCHGKLEVVVATHRHADHVSGFAGAPGKIIKSLKPYLVVQPWTEKPNLAVDAIGLRGRNGGPTGLPAANQRFAGRLDTLQLAAEQVNEHAKRLLKARRNVELAEQLSFIGETNIKNKAAVIALQKLGRRRAYASFGDDLRVGDLLPGVDVDVLGPPTLAQTRDIASMTDVDADEFWHLLAVSSDAIATGARPPIFPLAPRDGSRTQEARWLLPKVDRMQAEELLSLVRILDGVLNNTSLILLFSVGSSRLLFPGDAQLENWRYALKGAPNAAAIRRKLAGTRVYKVGHHGSLNATPKEMLWAGFDRAGAADEADRLITLLSTASGKHGDPDDQTEVPRKTLVKELRTTTRLFNTQDCNSTTGWWREVSIPL